MPEQVDLAQPILAQPGATKFAVSDINISRRNSEVRVRLLEFDGTNFLANAREINVIYEGATARNMMNNLNKANFSVKSMNRVIMERLQQDGYLDGIISGQPE